MKQLVVDPRAPAEIDDATNWYEEERDGLGPRFLEVLDQTLQLSPKIRQLSKIGNHWRT